MLRVLLVRHGETEWNVQGRYQGQVDTDLSPRGREQGQKLAAALKDLPIDRFFAGPLKRAYETAEMCAAYHHLPVTADERLTEIAHGTWEGRYSEDIAKTDGPLLEAWHKAPETVTMPEGESLEDVRVRVRAAFDDYAARFDGETILVAAHDAVNKAIIIDLLGMSLSRFWQVKQDNTCVNVLEYENGTWRVVTLNSTAHLGYLYSGIEQKGL